MKERDYSEDVGRDGRIILKWILSKYCRSVWTGLLFWLRIGSSGVLLWTRQWTFGFLKRLRISRLAGRLSAFQERLCSMEWVSEFVT
jgi:hypothetical protein